LSAQKGRFSNGKSGFILTGLFKEALKTDPLADINIPGFSDSSELAFVRNTTNIKKHLVYLLMS